MKMTPSQIRQLSAEELIRRYGIHPATLEDGTPAMQITLNGKEATTVQAEIVARKAEILAELATQAERHAMQAERRAAQTAQQVADAIAWMAGHGHPVLERSGFYGGDLALATLVDMSESDLAGYADWFLANHPLAHSIAPDPIALDCTAAHQHPTLIAIMSRPADGVSTASEGHYWLVSEAEIQAIRAAVTEVTQVSDARARQARLAAAQAIVDRVAAEGGPATLMSAREVAAWRKHYNDIANEGGEGYVPNKISREAYAQALEVLATET